VGHHHRSNTPQQQQHRRHQQQQRDDECFAAIDEETIREDFDFEANLKLFDKKWEGQISFLWYIQYMNVLSNIMSPNFMQLQRETFQHVYSQTN